MTVSQQHRVPTAGESESRLSAALEEYYAALDAGHPPDRAAFLAEHAEVADQLAGCLDGLEFVRAVAPQLGEDAGGAALDHPHIVHVYGVGSDRGVHFYAMQLIEGMSLAEVIAEMQAEKSGKRKAESGKRKAESF